MNWCNCRNWNILSRRNVLNFMILKLNSCFFRFSTVDFLVFLSLFVEKLVKNPGLRLSFRLHDSKMCISEHKLLNFHGISKEFLPRSNLDNPSNDDLQPTNFALIQFTKIINDLNDMKSSEAIQGGGIFDLTDGLPINLIISRESAIHKVRPI